MIIFYYLIKPSKYSPYKSNGPVWTSHFSYFPEVYDLTVWTKKHIFRCESPDMPESTHTPPVRWCSSPQNISFFHHANPMGQSGSPSSHTFQRCTVQPFGPKDTSPGVNHQIYCTICGMGYFIVCAVNYNIKGSPTKKGLQISKSLDFI